MRIILTRAHTLSSLAIRLRLMELWSHAAVRTSTTGVIDSTFMHGGVRPRELREVLLPASSHAELDVALPRELDAERFLLSQVGTDYDWRAIWGFATASRDWRDDYAWFCFELIAAAIEAGSDYRFRNRSRVTAMDLIEAADTINHRS